MTHRLQPLGWLDVLAATLILAILAICVLLIVSAAGAPR